MVGDVSMTTKAAERVLRLPSDQDASGRTLGEEECALVCEAIKSGTLTSTKGQYTKRLETNFATMLGMKHAIACSSGTAAVHCALAALDLEPGDEVITTPITDMGAISPILFQGAIPVFADVDPISLNVTPATIAARISPKTRAIVVTHLFGNPCETKKIAELAKKHNIAVIEDCAQAFLASENGSYVGSLGSIGCFSLQQGKHITTGEGGIVVTNDDALARQVFLFVNKAWGYGDKNPDHYFLALNYRLSELQGAVACAQLEKLESSVRSRVAMAKRIADQLRGVPGIILPKADEGNVHAYWRYALHVDASVIDGGSFALGKYLQSHGVSCAPRYIQKPAYMCQVIREQKTFGNSRFPFTLARPEAVDYSPAKFSGVLSGLESVLVLPWTERYTEEHVDSIASVIRMSVEALTTTQANQRSAA